MREQKEIISAITYPNLWHLKQVECERNHDKIIRTESQDRPSHRH